MPPALRPPIFDDALAQAAALCHRWPAVPSLGYCTKALFTTASILHNNPASCNAATRKDRMYLFAWKNSNGVEARYFPHFFNDAHFYILSFVLPRPSPSYSKYTYTVYIHTIHNHNFHAIENFERVTNPKSDPISFPPMNPPPRSSAPEDPPSPTSCLRCASTPCPGFSGNHKMHQEGGGRVPLIQRGPLPPDLRSRRTLPVPWPLGAHTDVPPGDRSFPCGARH